MLKKTKILILVIFILALTLGTVFALEDRVTVQIIDGGVASIHVTYVGTVGELLSEAGITLGTYDIVNPSLGSKLSADSENVVVIERTNVVTLQIGNVYEEREVPPGTTVSDLLQKLRNERGIDYLYYGAVDAELRNGQMLFLDSAKTEHMVEFELIPFETESIMTDQLIEGQLEVVREGEYGQREIVTKIVTVNGEVQSREVISDSVTYMPVTRIINIGTGKPEQPAEEPAPILVLASAEGSVSEYNWEYRDADWDGTWEDWTENWEDTAMAAIEQLLMEETFDPDAPPREYVQKLTMRATAYTADYASTGKNPGDPGFGITASGMKAQYGVVAVDPSVIALGTNLYIYGYGYCVAGDTGGAIKGDRIDLYLNTSKECYNFGHRTVDVYILD